MFHSQQKQCQIAVLPLGTGNDLARVLGWGSSCDDDAHLPQLLDRYEQASTKMLDRWSIMVFERGISFPRRGMSISHSPDAILSQFEDNAMWHLQVRITHAYIYSECKCHKHILTSLFSFHSQLLRRMIFKLLSHPYAYSARALMIS
jgi:Diacylglycerol kinase catalytic domain